MLSQGEQWGQHLTPSFLINSVGPDLTIPELYGIDQSMGSYQSQQDTHPALFGQNQLKDGFGPVYAIPSFPWNPNPNQGTGSNHPYRGHGQSAADGQQWNSHQQAMIPYCWCPPCYIYPMMGHRYY